jgi:4-methoxybenzoate monooxygenase (O-demethylating)
MAMSGLRSEVRATSDLDPFTPQVLADPFELHQTLRDLGPVVWIQKYDVYAFARHAEVHAALNDPASFSSATGVGLMDVRSGDVWRPPSLLIEADPPDHTRARRAVTSVLTPRVVATLADEFRIRAGEILDGVVERGTVDAVAEIAEAFPLSVFTDAVGLDPDMSLDERRKLLLYGRMVNNSFGPRNQMYTDALEAADGVAEWVMEQCQPGAFRPDSIGRRIHDRAAASGYPVPDAALIMRSLLSAGVETTVNGIANALLAFAQHPGAWQWLRENGESRRGFEEVLRFDSPVQVFFRIATHDIEIDEDRIPAGARVMLLLGSANRDPRAWEAPDRFDVHRPATGHVGFGSGIHACVGQMMARLEGDILLSELAARVATLEVTAPPERLLNNTLRGLEKLPLRLG